MRTPPKFRRAMTAFSLTLAATITAATFAPSASFAQDMAQERAAARRAAVDAARGQVDAARAQVQAASERVRATWTSRPEMLRAQMELDQARAELDRVSGPAFEKLRNSDEYKKALQEEKDANNRVVSERQRTEATQPSATQPSTAPVGSAGGPPSLAAAETDLNIAQPSDAQIDAAQDKLEVVTRRRQMEMDAAKADPATAEARARFEKATAEVKALQAQMRAAILNDPEYKAAQERLNAARAELARAGSANF